MIIKLILKDLRSSWKVLLVWTALMLAIDVFFISIEDSWRGFLLITPAQISFLVGYFVLQEKNSKAEVLTWSLPVSRSAMVASKYIAAGLISAAGILVWTGMAWIIQGVVMGVPDDFQSFSENAFVPAIAVFYLIVFISIFLPLLQVFNATWVFMNVMVGCLLFIFIGILLIHPSVDAYFKGIKVVDLSYFLIMALIAMIFLSLSYTFSRILIKRREL
jgi:ABC-type transport system involved in multi-copper enzyme maturation permease subunit